MKNILFKYIEFLLPKKGCIIIPDLGSFIINIDSSTYNKDGKMLPPSCKIVFNQDLKLDDGVLISHIQHIENISYNLAQKNLKDTVKDIRHTLITCSSFKCGNLGELKIDNNNNIIFISKEFIHPRLLGLSPVELNELAGITNQTNNNRKTYKLKYIWGTGVAAAAMVLLFFTPTINVGIESKQSMQQASFVCSLASTFQQTQGSDKEEEITSENIAIEKPNTLRSYYIIIGGEETNNAANVLLNKIQNSDFPKAQIIESGDRYRIYVASFNYKDEAENYLNKFRTDNPKYQTAWLYSKRNK